MNFSLGSLWTRLQTSQLSAFSDTSNATLIFMGHLYISDKLWQLFIYFSLDEFGDNKKHTLRCENRDIYFLKW